MVTAFARSSSFPHSTRHVHTPLPRLKPIPANGDRPHWLGEISTKLTRQQRKFAGTAIGTQTHKHQGTTLLVREPKWLQGYLFFFFFEPCEDAYLHSFNMSNAPCAGWCVTRSMKLRSDWDAHHSVAFVPLLTDLRLSLPGGSKQMLLCVASHIFLVACNGVCFTQPSNEHVKHYQLLQLLNMRLELRTADTRNSV